MKHRDVKRRDKNSRDYSYLSYVESFKKSVLGRKNVLAFVLVAFKNVRFTLTNEGLPNNHT